MRDPNREMDDAIARFATQCLVDVQDRFMPIFNGDQSALTLLFASKVCEVAAFDIARQDAPQAVNFLILTSADLEKRARQIEGIQPGSEEQNDQ